ncbi:MAG: hypothetical protein OHK0053_05310 [Microscillaceae bacterium]
MLAGFFLILLALAGLVASACIAFFYGLPLAEVPALMQHPPRNASQRSMHLWFQAISAFGGFLLTSWLFIRWVERPAGPVLNPSGWPSALDFAVVSLLFIGVMPLSSVLIAWNADLDFPAFLAGFEQWAREKEQTLGEFTRFLIRFEGLGELALGLLVIAFLPGLGEELLFRGVLQRNLGLWMGAGLAVWLAAAIFSAIHLQFFGFVPRVFLGVLLGYVYLWRGHLSLAVWGHTLNNGFTLLMAYCHQKGYVSYNILQIKAMPWPWVLASALITAGCLFYLRSSARVLKRK